MKAARRCAGRLPGVLGALAGFACAAALGAEPGLVLLNAADLSAPVRMPVCEVRVKAADGAGVLLWVLDGSMAHASFSLVPGQGARERLTAHKTLLARTHREKRRGGRYLVEWGGSRPASEELLGRTVYVVTLEAESVGRCPDGASRNCTAYRGSLAVTFRLRSQPGPGPIEELSTAARPVEFEERCSAENYRIAGLFFFPGWLERLGGGLLQGR